MNIKRVNCSKYLRMYVDDQLNWKYHIQYVYETLLTFVGIFYKLQHNMCPDVLGTLYNSFIHTVWCGDLCKYL